MIIGRRGKRVGFILLNAIVVLFLLIMTGCQSNSSRRAQEKGSNPAGKAKDIYFVGATQGGGGVWDLVGTGLGNVITKGMPDYRITFVPGEGVANVITLNNGKAEIGLAHSSIAAAGARGEEPFKERLDKVRTIASLFDARMHFIVLEDSPLQSISDIKAKKLPIRIAVGDPGSATELMSRELLGEYGITYNDIKSWGGKVVYKSMGDAASMMSDGLLDVLMITGTAPMGAVQQIASSRKLRMLPIDKPVIEALDKKYGFAPAVLPKGVYNFVDKDIPTTSFHVILATHTGVPEDVVYSITKSLGDNLDMVRAIHANMKELSLDYMAAGTGVALHPGAKKYYQEKGVIK